MVEVCKESFFVHRYGLYFRKYSYLVDTVNNLIQGLQSNGILSLWVKQAFDRKYLVRPIELKKAKSINIDHFKGALTIYMVGLVISFLIFNSENLSLKLIFVRRVFIWVH